MHGGEPSPRLPVSFRGQAPGECAIGVHPNEKACNPEMHAGATACLPPRLSGIVEGFMAFSAQAR